ncbi:Methyltransferase domain-containing protein [Actinopolymorpha cephalotaxi]|uniref:Methyltransferase domain-containing protein n=1 Tax=Actinopolymorpha cephalotaxi TaxID=504797 RepID=A0A1I2UDB3_9ACTN|nr:class I SAM-dependent methyltransferase [Actinopolymorpha cephalotaxi]NYH86544.1 SAM-dependent methyltransferase [Actinopolymorpha cephalotaxi]SFG75132.1 Methyltransferase domain-containing protein [Actinopolymorpha cephalotaxi]
MSTRYDDVLDSLRVAYDGGAERRDAMDKAPWKLAEREAYLDRLRAEGVATLLEVGAGTGQDSAYFRDHGLRVAATDLSPAMVERCREKGIDAHVADFLHLGFPPESFDAAYAMNCLLHVPNADLPAALESIATVLRPGGLFYLGVYGGAQGEGPLADDRHDPPRFFASRTDEELQDYARQAFEVVDFHVVEVTDFHGDPAAVFRFQSLTLRRPA